MSHKANMLAAQGRGASTAARWRSCRCWRPSPAPRWCSTDITVRYCTDITVRYSACSEVVQYRYYSTVQYSTVQYSTTHTHPHPRLAVGRRGSAGLGLCARSPKNRAVSKLSRVFTVLREGPYKGFSLLNAPTRASTIKDLVKHYAKWAFIVEVVCLSETIIANRQFD